MAKPFAWRLDVTAAARKAGSLSWPDEIAGAQRADPLTAIDVVIARKDTARRYPLAVTVDDTARV